MALRFPVFIAVPESTVAKYSYFYFRDDEIRLAVDFCVATKWNAIFSESISE